VHIRAQQRAHTANPRKPHGYWLCGEFPRRVHDVPGLKTPYTQKRNCQPNKEQ